MGKYIILIECEGYCIDLHCTFSCADNFCTVEITNPFDDTFIITKNNARQVHIEAAQYILDKGRIVSIIPIIQKHTHNFFHTYIRIEQINRHLSRLQRDCLCIS